MAISTLVLDMGAVNVLSGAAVSNDWFQECTLPPDRTDLRRAILGPTA